MFPTSKILAVDQLWAGRSASGPVRSCHVMTCTSTHRRRGFWQQLNFTTLQPRSFSTWSCATLPVSKTFSYQLEKKHRISSNLAELEVKVPAKALSFLLFICLPVLWNPQRRWAASPFTCVLSNAWISSLNWTGGLLWAHQGPRAVWGSSVPCGGACVCLLPSPSTVQSASQQSWNTSVWALTHGLRREATLGTAVVCAFTDLGSGKRMASWVLSHILEWDVTAAEEQKSWLDSGIFPHNNSWECHVLYYVSWV